MKSDWLRKTYFLLVWMPLNIYSLSFDLPSQDAYLIGRLQWTQARANDTLLSLSREHGVGYHEIEEANPMFSNKSIEVGTPIVLPTAFVLPSASRKGIVINLAELRLYYYDQTQVFTYPIGIGRVGWETPVGCSYVLEKLVNPTWHVPESIRIASEKAGVILSDKVSPGEDNPLGPYALRLHYYNYLIHGTNELEGVGRRSTAGCIRMFPEDIKELFDKITTGTAVNIINEPYKIGKGSDNRLYIEAHVPLERTADFERSIANHSNKLVAYASKKFDVLIASKAVQDILRESVGMPVPIKVL